MAFIEVRGISKSFPQPRGTRHVLRDVSLDVDQGEFVSIVGAMGSGKSTLLSLLAGLTTPDAGTITIGGERLRGIRKDAALVFQNYSLLPWFTALENVRLAVGAAFPEMTRDQQRDRARHTLESVGLGSALNRRPRQLSGGMRQRVAIARAFATDPQVLFLDEPFGALDALTRETLQQDLTRLATEVNRPVTTVMITNNVEEAILLSDRIVPMIPGPPATLGPPIAVELSRPRSVAQLAHEEHATHARGHVVAALTASRPEALEHRPSVSRGITGAAARRGRTSMNAPLELTGLTKIFPTPSGPFVAVKDVNAKVETGEFVAILGHSGCGKSTVLSILAGLDNATFGGVIIDGREVTDPGPERAIVFQAPCLLPWLTARQNVQVAATQGATRRSRREALAAADHYLALVGVEDAADQLPPQLSLGTQQCVSLARALSMEPRFLLLDEPFSMLDSLTRFELQDILLRVWEASGKTVVMVTHDVDEALYLADRLVLMTDGPEASVGNILPVPFARPRVRAAVLGHSQYHACRRYVIDFLEHHAHQSRPSALDEVVQRRTHS